MTVIWLLSLLAGGLTATDQLRRPESQWAAAGRERSVWVAVAIGGGVACLGIVAAVAYAVAVLPYLGGQPRAGAPAAPDIVAAIPPQKVVIETEDL